MPARIGIPQTLAFYIYYPWWKTFFETLGLEVVPSEPTNKSILDAGVSEAVNDACIPIKVFHGHVASLKEKVDYLFVPRMVSVRRLGTETFCPKFLGLPDLLRAAMSDLPEMVDVRVDLAKSRLELFRLARAVGERFNVGLWQVARAFWKAQQVFRRYQRLLQQRLTPQEAMELLFARKEPVREEAAVLSFAVLGYPYAVYDRFINVDLLKRLQRLGVKVLTAEMIPPRKLFRASRRFPEAQQLPKDLFWHFSNQVIQAACYFLSRERVDGIIHISAFGCGPDAMVGKLIELWAKRQGPVPFLELTIDEHTGEGGIQTRVEAFVDMIKRRRGLE